MLEQIITASVFMFSFSVYLFIKNRNKEHVSNFTTSLLRFWAGACIAFFPVLFSMQMFSLLFCDKCNDISDGVKPFIGLWMSYVVFPIFIVYFFLNSRKEKTDKIIIISIIIEIIGLIAILYT